MAELNDKLITYGNLSTFHDNLINDSVTSGNSTWSSEKIASEIQQGGGGGGSATIENVTYAQLKAKRDNSQLVKGQQYRITDYVTTAQNGFVSAGHAFDLVVTAVDTNKLSEDGVKAIKKDNDTYFNQSGSSVYYRWANDGEIGCGRMYLYTENSSYTNEADGTCDIPGDWEGLSYYETGYEFIGVEYVDSEMGEAYINDEKVILYTDNDSIVFGDSPYQYLMKRYDTETEEGIEHEYTLEQIAWFENKYFIDEGDSGLFVFDRVVSQSIDAKLDSWEVKYCIDNDTTRFSWAQVANEGLGFSAIQVADDGYSYVYVRYSDGDENNLYAWAYVNDSEYKFLNDKTINWEDINTEDIAYTDSETPSVGSQTTGDYVASIIEYSSNVQGCSDGKGVIYYLKDEFNNECEYDFKNILVSPFKYTFGKQADSLENAVDDTLIGKSNRNKLVSAEPTKNIPIKNLGKNIVNYNNSLGYTYVPSKNTFTFGKGNEAIVDEEQVFGRYNYIYSGGDYPLFTIGCGFDESSRRNALVVRDDGYMFVKGIGGYGGEGLVGTEIKTLQGTINDLNEEIKMLKIAVVGNYITFTSNQDNSIVSITQNNSGYHAIYYSNDKTVWRKAELGLSITLDNNESVYFCGLLLDDIPISSPSATRFGITGDVSLSGNMNSFINYLNPNSDIIYKGAFWALFRSCTGLTSASGLTIPDVALSENCCQMMFMACTNLTNSPTLLSTTLAEGCYDGMFYNCSSLTTAPELPATTLADDCYNGMFHDCTSLVTAPELPATTLANSCYNNMFYGCTSLTTAPSILPATTLANQCYQYMFYGCTSLTTAPQLPATRLVSQCYETMFSNCTNLGYIVCLAVDGIYDTGSGNYFATEKWTYNVKNSGTFIKNANANWGNYQTNDTIPYGWTVQNYVAPNAE